MLFSLKNVRMGKYKLPDGQVIKKGQTAKVSHSVITDRQVSRLISRNKFAVMVPEAEVRVPVTPSPEETPTDPPAPIDPPKVEQEEDKPILKRKRRSKKSTE